MTELSQMGCEARSADVGEKLLLQGVRGIGDEVIVCTDPSWHPRTDVPPQGVMLQGAYYARRAVSGATFLSVKYDPVKSSTHWYRVGDQGRLSEVSPPSFWRPVAETEEPNDGGQREALKALKAVRRDCRRYRKWRATPEGRAANDFHRMASAGIDASLRFDQLLREHSDLLIEALKQRVHGPGR